MPAMWDGWQDNNSRRWLVSSAFPVGWVWSVSLHVVHARRVTASQYVRVLVVKPQG
jgi:hypothetical protein